MPLDSSSAHEQLGSAASDDPQRVEVDLAVVPTLAQVRVGGHTTFDRVVFELEGDRLVHIHLGLIGKFDIINGSVDGPPPEPVGQVRLRLSASGDGRPPTYADLRGAILCALVTPAERDVVLTRLGPWRCGRGMWMKLWRPSGNVSTTIRQSESSMVSIGS